MGANNSWYKQIGNAVPVKLAEIIAKEIMELIFGDLDDEVNQEFFNDIINVNPNKKIKNRLFKDNFLNALFDKI